MIRYELYEKRRRNHKSLFEIRVKKTIFGITYTKHKMEYDFRDSINVCKTRGTGGGDTGITIEYSLTDVYYDKCYELFSFPLTAKDKLDDGGEMLRNSMIEVVKTYQAEADRDAARLLNWKNQKAEDKKSLFIKIFP